MKKAKCPVCKGTGLIKTSDWLIKGKSEKELAKIKEEALADIVEVVRCKDCRHQDECNQYVLISGDEGELAFCSYGERSEGNEDR
ncbi:MAG: hypothetical protein IKB51_07370 [Clostridia bacterium]|nr:hypothetical protein [Clostridia bacterium]